MMTTRLSSPSASFLRSSAYSLASSGLWMEQGPTITTTLSECPERMSATAVRAAEMVCLDEDERGTSDRRRAGWMRGSICRWGA
jgi:hypothetical protein